jgi:hypothetical protein
VPRRHRRAKTDAIDGERLLRTLMAWQRGEPPGLRHDSATKPERRGPPSDVAVARDAAFPLQFRAPLRSKPAEAPLEVASAANPSPAIIRAEPPSLHWR